MLCTTYITRSNAQEYKLRISKSTYTNAEYGTSLIDIGPKIVQNSNTQTHNLQSVLDEGAIPIYRNTTKKIFDRMIKILKIDGNDSRSMLNDEHMSHFNNILLENKINIRMQDTVYRARLDHIEINNNKFIQILHSGAQEAGHWVTVYHEDNIIRFFDSLGQKINVDQKLYLSRIFPNFKEIIVVEELCQIQKKAFNCGLFAIANTVSLLFGVCPCRVQFIESEMRIHLMRIFYERRISMFPHEFLNCDVDQAHFNHPINDHAAQCPIKTVGMEECAELFENWRERFFEENDQRPPQQFIDLTKVRDFHIFSYYETQKSINFLITEQGRMNEGIYSKTIS